MKTYEKIYDYLLEQTEYISGEKIAKEFNISRTSVWKAIKTLENKGIIFESITNKGYLLKSGDLIRGHILEKKLQFPVLLNQKSISTQQDAKFANAPELPTPRLYLANDQKQAFGRFNRQFFTQKNKGIYMTLHLKPNLPANQIPPYTILVAGAIVKAIFNLTNIKAQIKWVNDIYLNSKKIAGILTESMTSIETGLVTDIFIGVGLNFSITNFPKEIENIAGSLFKNRPSITREELINEIWKLFFNRNSDDLFKIYKDSSIVLGKEITYQSENKEMRANAISLTPEGHLIIEQNGKKSVLLSGEISLSSWES